MKKYLIILLTLLSSYTYSQKLTQTVRGTIFDEDGKYPLIGVNVILANSDPIVGTSTTGDGTFRLENIPVGRIDLALSYIGYENKVIPNVVVGSGKEVILNIEMQESVMDIDEVVVKAQKNKGEVLNEMALISSRSFSVEETQRYAGSFNDPSRMVSAFAGVASNPEGDNDIVVRGNSPKGILWRLEGVEIPNPNHFADEGSTGGPISALNSDLLANSDFFTGAFSPEYGNVLSGVFDINMRAGNNEQNEQAFGFGVLGTDLTLEGPFKKGYAGSYLVNYRYSSLDLLDKAGVVDFNGVPKFQDGAYKILLPTKKAGTFSFFGMGGLSSIFEENENGLGEIDNKGTYSAYVGVAGLNHTYHFTTKTFIRTSLSLSGNGSGYDWYDADSLGVFQFDGKGNWDKTKLAAGLTFSSKLNSKNRIIIGAKTNRSFYKLDETYFDQDDNKWHTDYDFDDKASLYQSYVSWKHRFNKDITIVSGVHAMYYDLNDQYVLEPRLGMKWKITPNQSINFGYGAHRKCERTPRSSSPARSRPS